MKKEKDEIEKKDTADADETSRQGGKYYYAVGRRKTAVAQVRLYLSDKLERGIVVNGIEADKYFTLSRLRNTVRSPLILVGQEGKANISVRVSGGGISGQAEAVRLGIARALVLLDNGSRKVLRGMGFLTRDARIVERKKPGLKKARKAPQWAKR